MKAISLYCSVYAYPISTFFDVKHSTEQKCNFFGIFFINNGHLTQCLLTNHLLRIIMNNSRVNLFIERMSLPGILSTCI